MFEEIVVGCGCQSPHSLAIRSHVNRFPYHPSTVAGSTPSSKRFETATGAIPGGAATHFWEAAKHASTCQVSQGSGRPPRDETASHKTHASCLVTVSATARSGFVIPVDVSLWTNA